MIGAEGRKAHEAGRFAMQRNLTKSWRLAVRSLAHVVLAAWATTTSAQAVSEFGAPSIIPPNGRLPPVEMPYVALETPQAATLPPDTVPAGPPTSPAADNDESELTTDPEAIEIQPLSAWYQPKYWLGPTWTGSIDLGMNGSEGNAQAFSFRAGANLKRETKLYTLTLEASHAHTTADSLETQSNALGKIKLDRNLGESPWTLFASGTAEYDEFKAFDLRLAAHAGVGYKLIKTEATTLIGRLGSGVSHEIGGPDESYVPEALLGLDFEHQITAKQKLVIKSEYLPEWGEFENYRLVTDASWECLLDEASNLSLKIGAIDRYDSTPNGLKANDMDYLLLLMWKL